MRILILVLLIFISSLTHAQYSSIALSETKAKKLGEISKKAVLHVVIGNEKDPSDAALLTAVKNYWKAGGYKVMGKAEFAKLKEQNELIADDLYLYEWLSDPNLINGFDETALAVLLSQIKTGYFYLSAGSQEESTVKINGDKRKRWDLAISLRFDLTSTIINTKDKILDGYFDLMVKYFDNEIKFCQSHNSIKDVKKEDKDGIVYFNDGLKDVQEKDILLIKEQVNKSKGAAKKEDKKATNMTAVSQFNPPTKNVYTVFPEDIKLALSKSDAKVLIFSNDMLISASNGAVIAAPSVYGFVPVKKDYAFWTGAIAILVSAFALATIMK